MPLQILPHFASAVISAIITKKIIDHPLDISLSTQVVKAEKALLTPHSINYVEGLS